MALPRGALMAHGMDAEPAGGCRRDVGWCRRSRRRSTPRIAPTIPAVRRDPYTLAAALMAAIGALAGSRMRVFFRRVRRNEQG
jgi:hypothetical protein